MPSSHEDSAHPGPDGAEDEGVPTSLRPFLGWLARRVRSFYGAIVTYLSAAFILAVGMLWLFLEVVDEVLEGSTQAFDEMVLRRVEGLRSSVADEVALEITALGNTATLVVLVAVAAVLLWQTRHRISVYLLALAITGGFLVNFALKSAFGRPRPDVVEWGTHVSSSAFPSGHAMAATIAYGGVAYLAGRLEPDRGLRIVTWTLAALLVVGVSLSRVYLGVHYPSDVLGGILAGSAWLAFLVSGVHVANYLRERTSGGEDEEI